MSAMPTALLPRHGFLSSLRAGPLAALLLLAGCGGGGGGGTQVGPPAASDPGCTSSTCGTLLVGFTDADGDFLSYSVDVVSLSLTRADGAVVQALPVRQRVDFAGLVDLTELVTAATIPNGTYLRASIRLDYAGSEVVVEAGGTPRAAVVVDAAGQPLGVVDLGIRLDNRNQVLIGPGRPALLQLDFDLAASHTVDVSVDPARATAAPFLVASVEPIEEKELRVRGPLVSVDTSTGSYQIDLRPFHHPSARLGQVTVHTTADTAFEIDGDESSGAAGLSALAAAPAGTPTIAVGTLLVAERRFTAEQVLAGTSVPGARHDVAIGNVMARTGDRLMLRGGTLIRDGSEVRFVRGDIAVQIGPETKITRDGGGANLLRPEAISVGQRIHAFGDARGTVDEPVLDSRGGRVRLNLTHLFGTVVSANPGHLALDLAAIDGRRPASFDFSGTGATPEGDADPEDYEVATGVLDLNRFDPGSMARAIGFVTPFGTAPPDFFGRTVVDYSELRAELGIGWGEVGTAAPFTSLNPTGLVLDLANPELGLRHHLKIGPRIVDLTRLPASPTVAPAAGRTLFAIAQGDSIEVFGDFARFVERLAEKMSGGARLRALHARGAFDAGSGTLTAHYLAARL